MRFNERQKRQEKKIQKPQTSNQYIMLKYSLILLGAYFLYYAGNIVYDLFLKKEKTVQTDVAEEYSLDDFAQAENEEPTLIGIEDVENLKTPKSFLKSEPIPIQRQNNFEDNPSLEELRKRFEEEEDLDGTSSKQPETKHHENPPQQTEISKKPEIIEPIVSKKKNDAQSKKDQWKEFVNLSETNVKLVDNIEGQKVYHSTI
ncbi:hypothetical protein AS358_03245 [Elizabethkingia anophelis]|uniref:Uncharacterized protein n=3 Tax=Weeksellaceae TaxID=2762318 RepID=A0A101CCZ2_9FLAO|nr:hypothetical protein AS358_03245 [Elizabethkingia anophelis]KUJ53944.1 hypothetical protein AR686_18500 [Chryseobacterium aquaticum subsp. greenlandense]